MSRLVVARGGDAGLVGPRSILSRAGWQLRAGRILLGGALRERAQYRADLVFTVLAGVLYHGTGFLAIWVILARFHAVAGWSITDVALLYGIRLAAHGLAVLPFNQLLAMENYVRDGTFDRFLIRPVNPLVQLLTSHIRLSTIGDVVGGFALLGAVLPLADISWSPYLPCFLLVALVGGALLEAGTQLALSALSFRTLGGRQLRITVDAFVGMYGSYPATIFGRVGKWALTTVAPVVFVAYLPASVLLGRADELHVPSAVAHASPLAGVVAFVLAYVLWHSQLRRYQGAGS